MFLIESNILILNKKKDILNKSYFESPSQFFSFILYFFDKFFRTLLQQIFCKSLYGIKIFKFEVMHLQISLNWSSFIQICKIRKENTKT